MIDEIKRTLYAGLGAGAVTIEKVDSLLQDLVARGKISADEARHAAEKVVSESKAEFNKSSSMFQEQFDKLLDKAAVAKKRDIEALRLRIEELERTVAELSLNQNKPS